MFDIDKAPWILWGAKYDLNTFGYIHAAFLRALKYLGKEAYWVDYGDDISKIDFNGALVLSMNCVLEGLPKNKNAFYVVHNISGDPRQSYFDGLNMMGYGVHVLSNKYGPNVEMIGPDIYFDASSRSMMMYWGTDLLPHEIEANKPTRVFNEESTVCNYIGSIDCMKSKAIQDFARACKENGIQYQGYGGYNNGRVVSLEEHIRLIKDSYMAPAFQGQDQVDQGYMSCRIFKNLSYGQMPPTHSAYANQLFGGKLIYNPDTYQLFHDAKARLKSMPVKELHDLMDEVTAKHTYLNKIVGIIHAVRSLENQ